MKHSWRIFFIPFFLVINTINGQYVDSQATYMNPQYYGGGVPGSDLGPQLMSTLLAIARDNGILSDILPVMTSQQTPYNIQQDVYGTSGGSTSSIASASSASSSQSGSAAAQTSSVATSTASSSVSTNSQAATASQSTAVENSQTSPRRISESANYNQLPEIPVMYPTRSACSQATPYQSQSPCPFTPPQYFPTPMPPPMPPIIIDDASSGNNCGSSKILPLLFLYLLSNNRGCGNCGGNGGSNGSGGGNNCCCMPPPFPYPPPFIYPYPYNSAPVQVDPIVTPTTCP
ncbi:unnamed protein product [Plutella xylostella]|uniref:(diamondback moth) hypothetical protein n=1 Tax=Plutella xylostella TaxID=51655 RepID=A0A8S4DZG9_PLUXY|nr:unnamed protein product [Plutella xylostella]